MDPAVSAGERNKKSGFAGRDLCDHLFCPEPVPDLVGEVFSDRA
jgi:hypothetical protein